jgi:hypothetical protein
MQVREAARHERPLVDEAALNAARAADKMLDAAREKGAERWIKFFEPVPDQLRDGRIKELRGVAVRARSAYGPKDSVRDALPADVTEPFLDQLDRLLRTLARDAMES